MPTPPKLIIAPAKASTILSIMRLLLISNSTRHGERYLDHCADAIRSLLGPPIQRLLFVPYAIHDHDAYAATVRSRFAVMGYGVDAVHDAEGGPLAAVGGGDQFVARYGPTGSHLSSRRFGGSGYQYGAGVAVGLAGNPIVAGYFQSTTDFGTGSLTAAGLYDGFLASLAP